MKIFDEYFLLYSFVIFKRSTIIFINFFFIFQMGQKINPNGIRITNEYSNSILSTLFSNYWFSDFKYSSLFYLDFSIKKKNKSFLMKYYKTRVRFIKGYRRRLKSILRTTNKVSYLSRLPYKIILLNSFFRPAGYNVNIQSFFIKKNNNNKLNIFYK